MHVREATPDDAFGIAQVRVETWRAAYAGLMPDAILDRLDAVAEELGHRARLQLMAEQGRGEFVVESGGRIVGWTVAGPSRDEQGGELYGLYVLPQHWGGGMGRALIGAAESFLASAGNDRAHLWVLDGNDRAAQFYEAHGWHEDGGVKTDDRFGGDTGWVATERRRRKVLSAGD